MCKSMFEGDIDPTKLQVVSVGCGVCFVPGGRLAPSHVYLVFSEGWRP